ncbi:hypothetical protein MVLG_01421 [Microbotryum lychnidis-dioicae p1A1 Lamole]|uniref:Arrestin-like N-terminal domain-containing protein n=1 Tax=Microbotryum lychnidis-dioicae (strain p1A1 Lamole / MvSl-1064) TaxID=683840 RepID=U5H228_USTV1|nr:hypothetical protein MVLG_01421 [Microbotryum lychnidis-dioicae p1A1 Lamole]|eukprot:KDE08383.1 hypothetical protein MVLG_01421 [Microbotryum lychnidis-dioicae p1A1 Lamole]
MSRPANRDRDRKTERELTAEKVAQKNSWERGPQTTCWHQTHQVEMNWLANAAASHRSRCPDSITDRRRGRVAVEVRPTRMRSSTPGDEGASSTGTGTGTGTSTPSSSGKQLSRNTSPSAARSRSPAGYWGRPGGAGSRSSSTGSFLSRLVDTPSLKVNFTEDLLFLHPGPPDQPTYDPSVEGTVTLYLPKGRTLRHLSVKLQGICSIGFQHRPYETFTCLEKELTLVRDIGGGADTYLERGEHIFSFSILVPSNTAPYERNAYGRVRHFVSAKAKGLGNFGDLKSEDKNLYLVVNPGGAGESQPPPPLDYKFEGASEDLGPYTLALQSQFIIIAGLILFRFRLLGPPSPIAIYSIRLKVLQYFTLTAPSEPNYVEKPPPESRTVFLLDLAHPPNGGDPEVAIEAEALAGGGVRSGSQTPRSGPWFALKAGEEYKVAHLARFLNDNILRGSTVEGIETGIHIRHEIAVEVTYSAWEEDEKSAAAAERERSSTRKGKNKEVPKEYEKKLFVVTKPIDIFSCCSWLDSLTLPEYSVDDPIPPPDPDQEIPCTCGYSMAGIVGRHGGFLKEVAWEGESSGLTFATQYKHDEGTSSHPGSGANSPALSDERRGRPPVRQFYQGFQSLSLN